MFTWLNKQGVRSDQGFEVQFTGRFDAEYRAADGKLIKLYVENGVANGDICIILMPNSFSHWSDGTPISSTEQTLLLQNFKAALEFQGLGLVVEG